MSIFSKLKSLVATPVQSLTVADLGDDFLPAPPGNIFYEVIPIPEGPGKEQIRMIESILPPVCFSEGPWICGGAARRLLQGESLNDGDVDLFFRTKDQWKKFCKELEGFELIVETKRAKTFMVHGIKVQCINRQMYSTLEDVFKDFDFSVCQIATDGRYLACTKQAHLDIMDEVLRLAPAGKIAKATLVQRLSKYVNYGFIPEPGLFEIVVKSGLDYVSAYNIFESETVAIYDIEEGDVVEEIIPTEELDAGVLRTIARKLGMEKEIV